MERKPAATNMRISDPIGKRVSAFEMSMDQDHQTISALQSGITPQAGDPCPHCQTAKIDYDNMLNLSCPGCGYSLAGCFT